MFFEDPNTAAGRSASRPYRRTVAEFIGEEILASGAGWTAASLSAWLVSRFFVERSWKNLWGLTATRRTALASDDYSLLAEMVAYLVGLVVLIAVRQLVIGTIQQFVYVRPERTDPGAQ